MLPAEFEFEIIVSRSYGVGIHLSARAEKMIAERKGFEIVEAVDAHNFYPVCVKESNGRTDRTPSELCKRSDPDVIAVIRELGSAAKFSETTRIDIVKIVAGVNVTDNDGFESVEGGFAHSDPRNYKVEQY